MAECTGSGILECRPPGCLTPQLSEEHRGWIECPVLLVAAGRAHELWQRNRGIEEGAALIAAIEHFVAELGSEGRG